MLELVVAVLSPHVNGLKFFALVGAAVLMAHAWFPQVWFVRRDR